MAELVSPGEDPVLHGKKGARRIGDVYEIKPALLGDLLGPEVLLAAYRVVGPGGHPAVVGEDHYPVAVDLPYTRYEARRGYILCQFVINPEPGTPAQLEKFRARIDELFDKLARRFFALFVKAFILRLSSRVIGFPLSS